MSRVLLVDDDKNLLRIAQMLLIREEPTFNLVTATSSREALRRLKETHFDVVVADYQIPGMDGLELLECLRQEGNTIPFIIFTGRGREEVAIRALNLGADYYLRKEGPARALYAELGHIIRQLIEHRQTEEALQEARIRAQNYLDIAAVMILALASDGTVSMINQKGCEILGYPEDEIIGQDWFDTFLPARLKEEVQTVFTALMAGNIEPVEHFENPVVAKSGEERLIAWHNRIVTENDMIVGILRSGTDITDHKQIEKVLWENKEQYRRLVEDQIDFLVRWLPDGTRTYVNPSYCRYFGKPSEELVGTEFYPDVYEEDRAAVRKKITSLIPENPVAADEHRIILPDGSFRWNQWVDRAIFDNKGNVVEYQSVGRDITDRKSMEDKLRASEEQYRTLVEEAPQGITIWQDDSFVFVNPTFAKLTSYTREEIIGFSYDEVWSLVHPDDRASVLNAMQGHMEGTLPGDYVEHRFIRKDGQLRWVRVIATIIMYKGKQALQTLYDDITDRKQAENTLRESEERFRVLFENAAIGMVVGAIGGPITATNPAFQKFLGYSEEELMQMTFVDYTHPDDLQRDNELFEEMIQENRDHYQIEKRYIRKDRQVKWGRLTASLIPEDSGQPQFGIGMVEDITDRKRSEDQIAYLAGLVENVSDAIISTDQHFTIRSWNRGAQEIYGWHPEEAMGKNVGDLLQNEFPGRSMEEVIEEFAKAGKWEGDVLQKTKDGKPLNAYGRVSAITDSNGVVIGAVAINRDITAQKQAQIELQQQREELSEFAHAMAHDLRNPLLSIRGYAKLLKATYDESYTTKIGQLAQQLQALLERSVTLADAGQVIDRGESIDLTELVHTVVATTIPETIRVTVESFPTVVGDREKLTQVFQNLFENAVIHGNPRSIDVRHLATAIARIILISNDGNSIPKEHHSELFRRGFTTKENGGGLGLTIVQKIVKAHGWQIRLETTPETTFRITIPAQD